MTRKYPAGLAFPAITALTLGSLTAQAQPAQNPSRRPGDGRTPEWTPPSITEYKPKSRLIVAEHPTPRAKYPVIDIHSHQPAPITTRSGSSTAWSCRTTY